MAGGLTVGDNKAIKTNINKCIHQIIYYKVQLSRYLRMHFKKSAPVWINTNKTPHA